MLITIASPVGISNVSDVKPKLKATSKRIFLMHINSIIIDSMCGLSFLNKRVSLVYGDTLLTVYLSFSSI